MSHRAAGLLRKVVLGTYQTCSGLWGSEMEIGMLHKAGKLHPGRFTPMDMDKVLLIYL